MRANSTKEFSEQFEGVTGHYPVKQGFWGKLRAPESSPERSAKSLSHSFFVVPFLSPIIVTAFAVYTTLQKFRKGICFAMH